MAGSYLERGGSVYAQPFPYTSTSQLRLALHNEPERPENSQQGVIFGVHMSLKEELTKFATRAGGAHKTVSDRQNIAGRLADTLKAQNIQIKEIDHLKSRHIEAYMKQREADGLSLRSRQNEMAALRGILREAGRNTLADSERISNKALGINNASRDGTHRAMPQDRYNELTASLAESNNKDALACVQLQFTLGLRCEEAIQANKSLNAWEKQLIQGESVRAIYGTKGGRSRDIRPVDCQKALEAVRYALERAKENGGTIINKDNLQSAGEHLAYVLRSHGCVGEYSPHSLRYSFACASIERYETQGFSHKDALAMTSQDLGHGDGRGRYIEQVYSRR
jgi:site-specific recombinase XerD